MTRGGLLQQPAKRVPESAWDGEITDHLGHEKCDPAGVGQRDSRNGVRAKTAPTDVGLLKLPLIFRATG